MAKTITIENVQLFHVDIALLPLPDGKSTYNISGRVDFLGETGQVLFTKRSSKLLTGAAIVAKVDALFAALVDAAMAEEGV